MKQQQQTIEHKSPSGNASYYEYTWLEVPLHSFCQLRTDYRTLKYTGDLPIDRDHLNVDKVIITKWEWYEWIPCVLLLFAFGFGIILYAFLYCCLVKPRHEQNCARAFPEFNEAVCKKINGRYEALTGTQAYGTAMGIGGAFGQQPNIPNLPTSQFANATGPRLPIQGNQFNYQQLPEHQNYGATAP
eukprot:gb/GECG01013921.1/.p1 GENE.gb/GECG01013921.1/~~gb/GECG01013921.1/.p1  ORF type:complete len:187 (+),score=17.89 gb/GECG01013921.1/:1-561(+)